LKNRPPNQYFNKKERIIMKITGPLAEKGLHVFDKETHVHAGHEIPRIWFVVADRVKAHVYRKSGDGLELIADLKAAGGKTKDAGSHVFKADGPSLKGNHDPRGQKKHHGDVSFVHTLTQWLDMAEKEHVFDRLVIIAAPHTLGEIRPALPRNVHDRVTAEIDKDLTGAPVKEIFDHLNESLWF
jgi:protein required for attachment to host cells